MEEKHEINFKTKVKNLRYLIIDNNTIIIIYWQFTLAKFYHIILFI